MPHLDSPGTRKPIASKKQKSTPRKAKGGKRSIQNKSIVSNPWTFGLEFPLEAHDAVLKGLPFSTYLNFEKATKFTREDLLKVICIPPRSLDRRRKSTLLKPNESDRLLRFARLFLVVRGLFEGDEDAARKWMQTPRPALGGRTPLELAATEIGSRQVETLVWQLENGVFV